MSLLGLLFTKRRKSTIKLNNSRQVDIFSFEAHIWCLILCLLIIKYTPTMFKKKACIQNLASSEEHSPPNKISKIDDDQADANDSPETILGSDEAETSAPCLVSQGDNSNKNCVISSSNVTFDPSRRLSYLSETITSPEIKAELREKYNSFTDYFNDTTGIQLCHSPFRHCVIPKFITNEEFVNNLESALLDLPLRVKNNDLYKFSQSKDLNHSKSSMISSFRSMCEVFREFLINVTDIPLNSKIDLFCSQYKYTDTLLCHDDELEERRIAFIYYLVPEDWSIADGGTLDLFDSGEFGQPKNIVKSIVPKRNSFLFFEVSALSFHQVSEVLSKDKTRLSISGWFHGPPLSRPEPHVEPLPPAISYGSIEEDVFYAWFNPLYLAPDVQAEVRKKFEEDSEIELTDFLQEEKYNMLVAAMQDNKIDWSRVGPPNKRNYSIADNGELPYIVSEFVRILHSDAAFLVLSNLTGLKLHPLAKTDDEDSDAGGGDGAVTSLSNGSNPRCRNEVRRWQHGCYTLAHDTDTDMLDFALDTMMFVNCENEWSFDNGGYTSYIAKGEDDELLSVSPSGNSFALVYRDKDTVRFVKHINHRVTTLANPCFFEFNTVYYE